MKHKKFDQLEWVIESFLEEHIDSDSLRVDNYRKGVDMFEKINKILTMRYPPEYEKMDVKFNYEGPVYPTLFDFEISDKEDKERMLRQVLSWRSSLNEIWRNFKKFVNEARANENVRLSLGQLGINVASIDNRANISLRTKEIAFLGLLNGLPLNCFRNCKLEGCTRWFVTKRSDRKYCSQKCSGNYRQQKLKAKDPEKYKEYQRKKQRERYRKKCGLKVK